MENQKITKELYEKIKERALEVDLPEKDVDEALVLRMILHLGVIPSFREDLRKLKLAQAIAEILILNEAKRQYFIRVECDGEDEFSSSDVSDKPFAYKGYKGPKRSFSRSIVDIIHIMADEDFANVMVHTLFADLAFCCGLADENDPFWYENMLRVNFRMKKVGA